MKKIRITSYLVSIKKLRERHARPLKLGAFDGGTAALDVVRAQLSKSAVYTTLKELRKVFRIELFKSDDDAIRGRVWVGEYGATGDIVDTESGEVNYRKGTHEAGLEPYYFHLALPPNGTQGILCVQQLGRGGAKSILDSVMTFKFNAAFPDYRMHVQNLSLADELAKHLEKGEIEEVTAEKHEIPADIADQLSGKREVRQGKITFTVKPKDHGFFKRSGLLAYARGEQKISDVLDVGDIEFDEVTAIAHVRGSIKKLVLSKPDRLGMSFDITDDVEIGGDGHPTPASLRHEVDGIITELAKRGGVTL